MGECIEAAKACKAQAHCVSKQCQDLPRLHFHSQLTHDRYDLEDTFEVLVGKPLAASESFTIYTNVFTGRSGVLGKVGGQQAPVDLKGEDRELFQAYLNCVYFGAETIEQWADELQAPIESDESDISDEAFRAKELVADVLSDKLIRLYLLAGRLGDLKTSNLVISEIIRFSYAIETIPTQIPTSLAYAATVAGNPLRKLLRDLWIYDLDDMAKGRLYAAGFPLECLQDIAIEMLRVVREEEEDFRRNVNELCDDEVCRYHQHDEMYPACSGEDIGM
jgi:hypothetical protein